MILTDATIVLDGLDLSGNSNEISLEFSRSDLDSTTFRSGGAKEHTAGLMDVAGSVTGFWSATAEAATTGLAGADGRFVIAPSGVIGSTAYTFPGKVLNQSLGGAVDDLMAWSANFASASKTKVTQRTLLQNPSTVVSAIGASSGVQLGSLTVGQNIEFGVHILSLASGTATVLVESSATNAWTSPTTEKTFTLAPGAVSYQTVTGAIVRPWWRVKVSALSGPVAFIATASPIF